MLIRRVLGPPGTGKTTWVARQCRNAATKFGPEGALVCSLTKAAANEAGGRDTGLATEMVGTLHAHCYRALGRPKLVERAHLEAWNREVAGSTWQQSAEGAEDEMGQRLAVTEGDRLRQQFDLCRARMVPEAMRPAAVVNFGRRWVEFKQAAGVCDFTDLIEQAVSAVPTPPHQPSVIFVDEAQDLSALELELVRRWMSHVEHVVLVGDRDQALYHWRGADPTVLAGDPFKVLDQSHRVPRAVHAQAVEWIERCVVREPVVYRPKDEEGEVSRHPATYLQPDSLLSLLEARLAAGSTAMVLAACSYHLEPLCALLRREGIAYGNRFSPGRWNPLSPSHGMSARDRILAFVRAESIADFRAFVPLLRTCDRDGSGPLVRGAKRQIEDLADDANPTAAAATIQQAFRPEALPFLRRGEDADLQAALDWFADNILPAKASSLQFPLQIVRRHGIDALRDEPAVTVGTIHSVKGGEADTVVVWPDLSYRGYQEFGRPGWAHRDAIWRLFYVAATRAKRELIIGTHSGGPHVEI